MADEVKKCLVCAMSTNHRFRECDSINCECLCLEEIHGSVPLAFDDYPRWFRVVTRKEAERFTKIHSKKGH